MSAQRDSSNRAKRAIKRDEIAARQLHALRGYSNPRDRKLRLSDVKEMFEQMRDHIALLAAQLELVALTQVSYP